MIVRTINRKIFRYLLVSVISVVIGQLLLYLFFQTMGLDAALSNFLSVTLSTIPNYLMNRYWVWRKSGPHDFKREIAPYWIIAF